MAQCVLDADRLVGRQMDGHNLDRRQLADHQRRSVLGTVVFGPLVLGSLERRRLVFGTVVFGPLVIRALVLGTVVLGPLVVQQLVTRAGLTRGWLLQSLVRPAKRLTESSERT